MDPLLLDQIFLLLVGWGSLCWNKGCECFKLTFSYITRGFHPIARMRATWISQGYKILRDLMTPRHTLRMCASMFSQTCKWVCMCSQACMCPCLCSQTCKRTCMCHCMGFQNSLCSQIHMCPQMCTVIFVVYLPCPFFCPVSILHKGHHPPWLGASSGIIQGVLRTTSVIQESASQRLCWAFGPTIIFYWVWTVPWRYSLMMTAEFSLKNVTFIS